MPASGLGARRRQASVRPDLDHDAVDAARQPRHRRPPRLRVRRGSRARVPLPGRGRAAGGAPATQPAGAAPRSLRTFRGPGARRRALPPPVRRPGRAVHRSPTTSPRQGTGLRAHRARPRAEDYRRSGETYGLEIFAPIDDGGRFTAEVGRLAGPDTSSTPTRDRRAARVARAPARCGARSRHSYPHCWRCKKPVIFRATEQWFIRIDAQRPAAAGARTRSTASSGSRAGAETADRRA